MAGKVINTYAVIDKGIVTNIILADSQSFIDTYIAPFHGSVQLLSPGEYVGPGFLFDGVKFTAPAQEVPATEASTTPTTPTEFPYKVAPSDTVVLINFIKPVDVFLLDVPTALKQGQALNTSYSLVIQDSSGGASSNPITVSAGDGSPINGQPSVTIKSDFGALKFITDGKQYFAS